MKMMLLSGACTCVAAVLCVLAVRSYIACDGIRLRLHHIQLNVASGHGEVLLDWERYTTTLMGVGADYSSSAGLGSWAYGDRFGSDDDSSPTDKHLAVWFPHWLPILLLLALPAFRLIRNRGCPRAKPAGGFPIGN